jgi:hypothetical protein
VIQDRRGPLDKRAHRGHLAKLEAPVLAATQAQEETRGQVVNRGPQAYPGQTAYQVVRAPWALQAIRDPRGPRAPRDS